MVQHFLKYVVHKEMTLVAGDLKIFYNANTLGVAGTALEKFSDEQKFCSPQMSHKLIFRPYVRIFGPKKALWTIDGLKKHLSLLQYLSVLRMHKWRAYDRLILAQLARLRFQLK